MLANNTSGKEHKNEQIQSAMRWNAQLPRGKETGGESEDRIQKIKDR